MRFTKIKLAKDSVELEFQVSNKAGTFDHTAIVATEEPAPSFNNALGALASDMCDLCEFPTKDKEAIDVRGIKLSYHGDHDRMGIVITGIKNLVRSTGTVTLNSPLRLAQNGGKANAKRDASGDLVKKVVKVVEQATKFLKGYRSQTEMKL